MFLLMETINQTTGRNRTPYFHFDSTGKDGWANNSFWGGKSSLVYPFITNGIDIKDPKYVEPASHIYLELADFISFIIARYLHRRITKQNIEIDPSLLGDIFYLGFNQKGDPKDILTTGYPWEYFFEK